MLDPDFNPVCVDFDCLGFGTYDCLDLPGVCDCPLVPVCGNGILEQPPEQCDDGNTIDGDCCSANCQFETGPGNPGCCINAAGIPDGVCHVGNPCGAGCFGPLICDRDPLGLCQCQ